MRIFLIFIAILVYLFSLIYIESELVRVNIRKEHLKNKIQELKNQRASLQTQIMDLSNLARIENEAKKRGFIFPTKEDILGVIK